MANINWLYCFGAFDVARTFSSVIISSGYYEKGSQKEDSAQ